MTRNLTVGSPTKLILSFALPLMAGCLFQQLYSVADAVIVGKFLGVNALAGVGASGAINFMVFGFAHGTCAGLTIPIAQQFGAGDYKSLRKYVANAVWLMLFLATILTAITLLFTKQILIAMKTPDEIFSYAFGYIFTMFMGIPMIMFYSLFSGIMRALGDSKTPLFFLVGCTILNVVLDLVFILVFKMDVVGAGVATVLSEGLSGVLCFFYMRKKFPILKLQKSEWKISRYHIKNLAFIGIPMGLQSSIIAIGSIVLQTAVNLLGAVAVASVTASGKISFIFVGMIESIGSATSIYCGQNLGAGKIKRIQQGVRQSMVITSIVSVFFFAVVFYFGISLVTLFVDVSETEILANTKLCLTISAAFYVVIGVLLNLRYSLQGMGYSAVAMIASISEVLARFFVAFVLVEQIGFTAVCFSDPISWVFGVVFLIPAYFIVINKVKKKYCDKEVCLEDKAL